MRSREEVMHKFREMCAEKLHARRMEFLSRQPINCVHNLRMRLKGKGQVGVCQNPVLMSNIRAGVFFCNDNEVARRCKVFECKNTDVSVQADFDSILRSPSRCGNEYPKLAMMIWFLQEWGDKERNRWGRLLEITGRTCRALWGLISFRWW